MKNKRTKKIVKWFIIGISLTVLTLFVAAFVFVYLFLFGGPTTASRNIDNYESIFTERAIQTGYIVFPEHIPEGTLTTEYYHSYRDTLFDPTVETFLQCTYDDKTYAMEIDRLENTSKTYGNRKMILQKDKKKKFQYPAYIAIENAASGYEYALLTGENQITYIYTCFKEKNSVHFDTKYLPSDYMTEEGRAFGSGYSIYYANVNSDMINTDYTRGEVPEVTDGHTRIINDNYFTVRFRLDAEGREIITGCHYFQCEDSQDEGEETIYNDLNGYEYKSMEVSRDRSQVMIIYLDNGEEHTFIFNL